ncbi:hypothetical protein [Pseudomonas sp. ACM7]|uniref:hypothetical protein n=1 Tax=Pseudomonas sp. ACM7 TaxID=2052956 RepID=UPI0013EC71A8|nr:hypothetical protein [Pseudomonas sp. ACM7]
MFNITRDEINQLNDFDLRELVTAALRDRQKTAKSGHSFNDRPLRNANSAPHLAL